MARMVVERTVDSTGADYVSAAAFEAAEKRFLTLMRHYAVTVTAGAFTPGEDVTFSGGGAGRFFEFFPSTGDFRVELDLVSGEPATTETITGVSSGATATLDTVTIDAGEIARAILGSFLDTVAIVIDPAAPTDSAPSWATGTGNYIHFYVPLGNRHNFIGYPNNGTVYALEVASGEAVTSADKYCLFEGMVVIANSGSGFFYPATVVADIFDAKGFIYKCAITASVVGVRTDSSQGAGWFVSESYVNGGTNAFRRHDSSVYVTNCLGFGTTGAAFLAVQFSNTARESAENCYARSAATDGYSQQSGTGTWTTVLPTAGELNSAGGGHAGQTIDEVQSGRNLPFNNDLFLNAVVSVAGVGGGLEDYRPNVSGSGDAVRRLFTNGFDNSDPNNNSQWGSGGADVVTRISPFGASRNFFQHRWGWLDCVNRVRHGGWSTHGCFELFPDGTAVYDPPALPVEQSIVDPTGGGDFTTMASWEAARRRRLPYIQRFNVSGVSGVFQADERIEIGSSVRIDESANNNDLLMLGTVTRREVAGFNGFGAEFDDNVNNVLEIADNASLSFGDETMTIGCRFVLDDKSVTRTLIGKFSAQAPNNEYLLGFLAGTDRLRLVVDATGSGGGTTLLANNFGSVPTGTVINVIAWHDPVANTLNIQVNDGTIDTLSYSAGIHDGAAAFNLGRIRNSINNPIHPWDGAIDDAFVYRRILTPSERTQFFSGTEPTAISTTNLEGAWKLEERENPSFGAFKSLSGGVMRADVFEARFSPLASGGAAPEAGVTIRGQTSGATATLDSLIGFGPGEIEEVLIRGDVGATGAGAFTATRSAVTTLFLPNVWKASQHAYIRIKADTGHRHAGVFDNTKALHRNAAGVWTIQVPWTRIEGMLFQGDNAANISTLTTGGMVTNGDSNSPVRIQGCIHRWTTASGIQWTLTNICRGALPTVMDSCFLYKDFSGGNTASLVRFSLNPTGGRAYLVNCLLVGRNFVGSTGMIDVTLGSVRGADENCHFVPNHTGGTATRPWSNSNDNWPVVRPGKGRKTAFNPATLSLARTPSLDGIPFSNTEYQDTTDGAVDAHLAGSFALFVDFGEPVNKLQGIQEIFLDVGGSGVDGLPLGEGSGDIDAGEWLSSVFDIDGEPRPEGAYEIGIDELQAAIVAFVAIDDFELDTGLFDDGLFAASIVAKADLASTAAYLRTSMEPKDNSSTVASFETRRIKDYYTIPPAAFYQMYKHRLDLAGSPSSNREDGFRYDAEVFQDGEAIRLDGPTITQGGSVGSSFIHPDEPRTDEEFRFAGAVNLNSFQAEFTWMPVFLGFIDITADLEIARFEQDANNYLVVKLKAPDNRLQREFDIDNVYGQHDPILRLEKVRGGSVTDSVEVVAYYGYDGVDPAGGRVDDTLKITVMHRKQGFMALKVDRYGIPGVGSSAVDVTSFAGTGQGDIVYNGTGYYGQPAIVFEETDPVNRGNIPSGRKIPLGRADIMRRLVGPQRSSVLGGERDPLAGALVADPYAGDNFDRSDAADLGTDWDTLRRVGQGAAIVSNEVEISEEGFEAWNRRTRHANVELGASVRILSDNDLVGLLARLDTARSNVTGFGAELRQIDSTSAELRVVVFFEGTRTILQTTPLTAYNPGDPLTMRFLLDSTTLTAEVIDPAGGGSVVASIAAPGDVFQKPGLVGIYGQTGGAAQNVFLDDFTVTRNFDIALK